VDVITVLPGEPLSRDWADSVSALFRSCYYRYHYLAGLGDADRYRFIALRDSEVVGFAAARVVAGRAVLANLLVHPAMRGAGLGRALEEARTGRVRAAGLDCYTSCTCESDASQRLKVKVGMRPTAVRVGYRFGVAKPGVWGSSVVFTDEPPEIGEPQADSLTRDRERRRWRWTGAEAGLAVGGLWQMTDEYAEILTGAAGAEQLRNDDRVALAGVDLDFTAGNWLYCFQLRTAAYWSGLAQQPAIFRSPPGVVLPVPTETALWTRRWPRPWPRPCKGISPRSSRWTPSAR
jgi:GNAT superfamily N-acetyltransferase